MTIDVLFACGHGATVADDRAPRCPTCGCADIERSFAPPPRIAGCATGPHVTSAPLEAVAVDLTRPNATPLPTFKRERELEREAKYGR